MKSVITALCLLLSQTCWTSPVEASAGDRSAGWAYATSFGAFLIPAWIGGALLPESDHIGMNGRTIGAASAYYLSFCWGPSAGYYYSGNTRYATVSGVGKSALLGVGLALEQWVTPEDGHPYLLATAMGAILTWSIVDWVLLHSDVKRQNELRSRQSSKSPPSVPCKAHFALTPPSTGILGLSYRGTF